MIEIELSETANALFTLKNLLDNPPDYAPSEFVTATTKLVEHIEEYGPVPLIQPNDSFGIMNRPNLTEGQRKGNNLVKGYHQTKPCFRKPYITNICALIAARPIRAGFHKYYQCLTVEREKKLDYYIPEQRQYQ